MFDRDRAFRDDDFSTLIPELFWYFEVFAVLIHQFGGQIGEVFFAKTHDEGIPWQNIVYPAIFITQHTVWRQTYILSFIVHNDSHRVLERIDCLNISPYGLLKRFQSAFDLDRTGFFQGFD